MYVNGQRQELRDRAIGYYRVSHKIGGSSLGPKLFDWFCEQMGLEHNQKYLEIGTFDGVLLAVGTRGNEVHGTGKIYCCIRENVPLLLEFFGTVYEFFLFWANLGTVF